MPHVLILGSGLIGVDMAARLAPATDVTIASRRHSRGLARLAEGLGADLRAFDELDGILTERRWDVILDATSAQSHTANANWYLDHTDSLVDLTPSGLGKPFFPSQELPTPLARHQGLVSCGAQASVPVVKALGSVQPVVYTEIVTSGSSSAAGPATRANLDEYIANTQKVLQQNAGSFSSKVMVNLYPARPEPPFRVTIYAEAKRDWNVRDVQRATDDAAAHAQEWCEGYAVKEVIVRGKVARVGVEVRGTGPSMPAHFGSVDIINSAAALLVSFVSGTSSFIGSRL